MESLLYSGMAACVMMVAVVNINFWWTHRDQKEVPMNEKPKENWKRWKEIMSRIIHNPKYRYPAPTLLINLTRFARQEMGHWNTLVWK